MEEVEERLVTCKLDRYLAVGCVLRGGGRGRRAVINLGWRH
jgi:hypothetical protein